LKGIDWLENPLLKIEFTVGRKGRNSGRGRRGGDNRRGRGDYRGSRGGGDGMGRGGQSRGKYGGADTAIREFIFEAKRGRGARLSFRN
jgi:deoxyribodipyrimidine photo-lyase